MEKLEKHCQCKQASHDFSVCDFTTYLANVFLSPNLRSYCFSGKVEIYLKRELFLTYSNFGIFFSLSMSHFDTVTYFCIEMCKSTGQKRPTGGN